MKKITLFFISAGIILLSATSAFSIDESKRYFRANSLRENDRVWAEKLVAIVDEKLGQDAEKKLLELKFKSDAIQLFDLIVAQTFQDDCMEQSNYPNNIKQNICFCIAAKALDFTGLVPPDYPSLTVGLYMYKYSKVRNMDEFINKKPDTSSTKEAKEKCEAVWLEKKIDKGLDADRGILATTNDFHAKYKAPYVCNALLPMSQYSSKDKKCVVLFRKSCDSRVLGQQPSAFSSKQVFSQSECDDYENEILKAEQDKIGGQKI